ncbi:MAG TPA: hypothetical protein VK841_15465, partial [Polyangiaceae bacterium]|nr:hypothetical protein [Polyangiaceae bacterium]
TLASPTWQRPTAFAMGAFGGAALVVGAALGIIAANQWSDARRQGCSNQVCQNAVAWGLWSDARQNASAATVAVALGAAEVAGAAVVWLMAPAPAHALRIDAQPAGLRVTAVF